MWWLNLKAGDRVYVPMERNKQSGTAEVYSSGKKYIHISLHGTPMRIHKSNGCSEDYPYNAIFKDEKDHQDYIWQRKRMRDSVELLGKILSDKSRITAEDVDALEKVVALFCKDKP